MTDKFEEGKTYKYQGFKDEFIFKIDKIEISSYGKAEYHYTVIEAINTPLKKGETRSFGEDSLRYERSYPFEIKKTLFEKLFGA